MLRRKLKTKSVDNKDKESLSKVVDSGFDYTDVLKHFPWIIERGRSYVISPDSDGFLSALLLTKYLGGTIAGFYDGKVTLIHKDFAARDCIFIDVDINRADVRSVGHHMVTYNKRLLPPNFHYLRNCIQPNVLRGLDGKNDFQKKYPFATVHLIIGLLQEAGILQTLPENALWPLLFTDGVWNNLFGYTENCIEWTNFLKIDHPEHILNPIFCSSRHSFYEIMLGLNDFLRIRDSFNAAGYVPFGAIYQTGGRNRRTGDKLRISDSSGTPINIEPQEGGLFAVHENEKIRIEKFVTAISHYVDWPYISEMWKWNDLRLMRFTKGDFSQTSLNNGSYLALMQKNPLSLAMTDGLNIEYTLESPDVLV